MAGGSGTRLWPLSTSEKPKQFLDLLGIGKTMLQLTIERCSFYCNPSNIFIVTSKSYKDLVIDQCPEIPVSNILLEPCMRNTAPCIAYACSKIQLSNPDAKLLICPADQLITNQKLFEKTISDGLDFVSAHEALLTLGIIPNRPSTEYGYIQASPTGASPLKVDFFKEKPPIETAQKYLKQGNFYWNAGIFMSSLNTMSRAIKEFLPEISGIFESIKQQLNTENEQQHVDNHFPLCESISIDYGVLEKAKNTYVISAGFGWSDLGTFSSIFDKIQPKDESNNSVIGSQVHLFDSKNCLINVSDEKKIVVQGMEDFIIIETNDTLLIMKKDQEKKIKEFKKIFVKK